MRPCHEALREARRAEAEAMAAKGYVTPVEAAKRMGRGRTTIYRWLRDGILPSEATGPDGRFRWVPVSALDAAVPQP